MTEVIEYLALGRAKVKLKIETLKSSKTEVSMVISNLESILKDYDEAIFLLTNLKGLPDKSETIRT